MKILHWTKYSEKKPQIGQHVLVCLENRQIYETIWSDNDEKYAELNHITHWLLINYPDNP